MFIIVGRRPVVGRFAVRASGLVLAVALLTGSPGGALALDPKVYDSPEAAAADLIEALRSPDLSAILQVLGDEFKDEILSEDEAADREARRTALAAADQVMQLRADDADTRVMVIGKQAWPVPFPIIKTEAGWIFDTGAGVDELLARRVGRDELATISTLKSYVDAQQEYASEDRDGDEVLEYAQRVVSTTGQRDGLYWPVAEGSDEPLSPFGPFVAERSSSLEGREQGDPFMGYYYRVLTRQDSSAPGGRYDYIINGNMIAGFGMLAYPAEYGETGIMSFIVSHQGKILERDLGVNTDMVAAGIDAYNPEGWTLAEGQ